jgi:hypothetical protein
VLVTAAEHADVVTILLEKGVAPEEADRSARSGLSVTPESNAAAHIAYSEESYAASERDR